MSCIIWQSCLVNQNDEVGHNAILLGWAMRCPQFTIYICVEAMVTTVCGTYILVPHQIRILPLATGPEVLLGTYLYHVGLDYMA